jgi:hypothetical protein
MTRRPSDEIAERCHFSQERDRDAEQRIAAEEKRQATAEKTRLDYAGGWRRNE